MANRISDRMVKAFERFNADLKAFGEEIGETYVTLYEDAFTTRRVANFRLYKNGHLKWIEIETGQELQEAKASIPMGKELTKVDMFSYQTLRRIVVQRHNHRLPEWHQFIDWIKTLPLAEELILVGLEIK